MKKRRAIIVLVIIGLFVFSYGIYIFQYRVTKIENIHKHSRDYVGKTISIKGEVVDVFSFAVISYFQMDDGTDSIYVFSSKPMPSKGEMIKVTGVVRYFAIGKKRMLAIKEK